MKKKIIKNISLFVFFMFFAGILSLLYGMDRQLDVRNYHIYNPYAFLTDRIGTDFLPASRESYYAPFLDIPYYLAIKYLNNFPKQVTFAYGFSYALFLFIVYKIAKLVFKNYNTKVFATASIIIGASSMVIVENIGALNHDIFICDLMLIAFYFTLKAFDENQDSNLLLYSGLIAGITVGFKLTAFVFAIPLILTVIIFHKQFTNPLKSISLMILGILSGFLIIDGFWLYKIYVAFDNPFFPYFNWLFNSPLINQNNTYIDSFSRHIPTNIWQLLFYPFIFRFNIHLVFLWLAFIANLFTLPFINKEKLKEIYGIDIRQIDFILLFCFISFLLWVNTIAVPRYFSVAHGLTGIIVIAVLIKLFYIFEQILNRKNFKFNIRKLTTILLMSVLILITLCLSISTITSFRKSYFRLPAKDKIMVVQDMQIPDNSIVLTGVGVGIIIPFQNPKAKYIKNTEIMSELKTEEVKKEMQTARLYLLSDINAQKYANINLNDYENYLNNLTNMKQRKKEQLLKKITLLQSISRFGIDMNLLKCRQIPANFYYSKNDRFYLCRVYMKKDSE